MNFIIQRLVNLAVVCSLLGIAKLADMLYVESTQQNNPILLQDEEPIQPSTDPNTIQKTFELINKVACSQPLDI